MSLFSTIGQGWVFLWMALFGAAGGAVYLFCAAIRRLLRAGIWLSFASDLAFGLFLSAAFVTGLVTAVHGSFQLYCLIGFCGGFALFIGGFSRPLRRLCSGISCRTGRIVTHLSNSRLLNVILR